MVDLLDVGQEHLAGLVEQPRREAALLLGEDELAQNSATLRDLDTGEQDLVSLESLEERLTRFR